MIATRRPVVSAASRMRRMSCACWEKSPCEKFSRATLRPARMRRASISGVSEAGPMVATTLVLWAGNDAVMKVVLNPHHASGDRPSDFGRITFFIVLVLVLVPPPRSEKAKRSRTRTRTMDEDETTLVLCAGRGKSRSEHGLACAAQIADRLLHPLGHGNF